MQYRPKELAVNFKAFKQGDSDALAMVLLSEKERLFDYVMRMTGQLGRSADLTDEVISAIEVNADQSESLEELLVLIYKTARNFGRDIWDADTTKLENSDYLQKKDVQNLVRLEILVRSLPPIQKEIVLLRERFGFALDEVAEITVHPASDVEMLFARGLSSLEEAMEELSPKVPALLVSLSAFSKLAYSGPETQNLSLIMDDFRKTHRMAPGKWRWVRIGIYIALSTLAWVYSEQIWAFLQELSNLEGFKWLHLFID